MIMNSGAEGAETSCSLKMVKFFFTKYMANDDRFEPDALIPKIHAFICQTLGPGHLRGPGVSLGRILGGPSIEPFWGWASSQGAVSTPPPPGVENPPIPGGSGAWSSPHCPEIPHRFSCCQQCKGPGTGNLCSGVCAVREAVVHAHRK